MKDESIVFYERAIKNNKEIIAKCKIFIFEAEKRLKEKKILNKKSSKKH